jgi:peptidyl-tRNA hydrolase, PTH1 family
VKAIIGLGNPGVKYRYTRHNIGFLVIDQIINPDDLISNSTYFSAFKTINDTDVLFLKPTTYMNLSGSAYKELFNKYPELKTQDTLVIYDDCHLQLGKIRFREKGSDAGHNGIKDIINKLESNEFPRLKFGINEPEDGLIDHVLGEFTNSEEEILNQSIDLAEEAITDWLANDTRYCMNKYNGVDLNQ